MSSTLVTNLVKRGTNVVFKLLQPAYSSLSVKIVAPSIVNLRHKSTSINVFSHDKMHTQPLPILEEEILVEKVILEKDSLKLTFNDGSEGTAPFLWLRDNCQCSSCFDRSAQGRKSLLQDINENITAEKVHFADNIISVVWNDGHVSEFSGSWCHERSFTHKSRELYRTRHQIEKESWDNHMDLDNFDYSKLRSDDKFLMDFLMCLERKGVCLIKNTTDDPDAGALLVDHIAFVKMSHYGRRSPVLVRESANNLAYSGEKLGLHNDLTQYSYQAGIIFIQTLKQHLGKGGESIISDGLHCSRILQKNHPNEFQILTDTNIYFWDFGNKSIDLEMDNFHKISKHPVIGLDKEGNLETLRINNQTRDSHLDIEPTKVNDFYRSLMLFNQILYENSYSFKMENGDILVLDNVRCIHGREGFDSASPRHLESVYLDWDEARCKRRRLQHQFNKH